MLFDIEHLAPLGDDPIHIDPDPTPSLITVDPAISAQVTRQIEDGLLTPAEAARTLLGRQLSSRLAGSPKGKEHPYHAL